MNTYLFDVVRKSTFKHVLLYLQIDLALKRHLQKCHSKKQHKLACKLCEKFYFKREELRRHEFWKHGIPHQNIEVIEPGP